MLHSGKCTSRYQSAVRLSAEEGPCPASPGKPIEPRSFSDLWGFFQCPPRLQSMFPPPPWRTHRSAMRPESTMANCTMTKDGKCSQVNTLFISFLTHWFICVIICFSLGLMSQFGVLFYRSKSSATITCFCATTRGPHCHSRVGGCFITSSDSLHLLMYSRQCFLGAHRKWPWSSESCKASGGYFYQGCQVGM